MVRRKGHLMPMHHALCVVVMHDLHCDDSLKVGWLRVSALR